MSGALDEEPQVRRALLDPAVEFLQEGSLKYLRASLAHLSARKLIGPNHFPYRTLDLKNPIPVPGNARTASVAASRRMWLNNNGYKGLRGSSDLIILRITNANILDAAPVK